MERAREGGIKREGRRGRDGASERKRGRGKREERANASHVKFTRRIQTVTHEEAGFRVAGHQRVASAAVHVSDKVPQCRSPRLRHQVVVLGMGRRFRRGAGSRTLCGLHFLARVSEPRSFAFGSHLTKITTTGIERTWPSPPPPSNRTIRLSAYSASRPMGSLLLVKSSK